MVHLGPGVQYVAEGGKAYLSPSNPQDVVIETKKIGVESLYKETHAGIMTASNPPTNAPIIFTNTPTIYPPVILTRIPPTIPQFTTQNIVLDYDINDPFPNGIPGVDGEEIIRGPVPSTGNRGGPQWYYRSNRNNRNNGSNRYNGNNGSSRNRPQRGYGWLFPFGFQEQETDSDALVKRVTYKSKQKHMETNSFEEQYEYTEEKSNIAPELNPNAEFIN